VPKKIANASQRRRRERRARIAPTNVASVSRIVRNAKTRFEN
jgi:hypothetical protein